jgi:hypothetical protein
MGGCRSPETHSKAQGEMGDQGDVIIDISNAENIVT